MPKRSLNRVLGASSLELKCLLLFGLFLAVVITASFLMYWHVTGKVVKEQNPIKGRLLVGQVLLITHWSKMEPADTPNAQNWKNSLASLTQNLINQKFKWRFIGRPDDRDNQQDPSRLPQDKFEKELLSDYLHNSPQGGEDEERGRPVNDGAEYQYYQPVRVTQPCRTCHSTVGWGGFNMRIVTGDLGGMPSAPQLEVGDLLAVVQVTIPNGDTQAAINKHWGQLLAVAIITGFLALVAFYVVIRSVIIRPLRHLRQVSDAISHGNIAQRAEIHTGDEFETLAVAFNRMLRHLVTIQDELRQVNTSLDSKVDELAQVNMQLYEMNRIKSDFLATMSHELRTPLNSILGFSDVLGAIASLDEKQKRYVQNIQKSGRMLLDMINNILDLAKIESGKMEIRLTDFSIAQVIGAQCDMARPLTERKNIDLEAEVQPDLPPMHQDQARVQQVLNNLLSNAAKFTPEGGRIKVAAERSSHGELLLRVIDTGVGIAEEDQQAIFEKFRQGRTAMPGGDAMTREYSGTGLGLSIVKEICKLLEGAVSVESELGTGSTFTVRLPWRLERQPRLDSPLVSSFEEFGKPHSDLPRNPLPADAGERS